MKNIYITFLAWVSMALQSVIQIFLVAINTCIWAGQTVHFTSIMQALYNRKEGVLVTLLHSDLYTICSHLHIVWTEGLSYPSFRPFVGLFIILLPPFPPIFIPEFFDQQQQIWKLGIWALSKWNKINPAYTTASFLRIHILLHVMLCCWVCGSDILKDRSAWETSPTTHLLTQCHTPEDLNPQPHYC